MSAAFAMVVYGGAGPLHASAIARELGIRRVIIPFAPGYFSAYGMLFSDLRYDYVRSCFKQLATAEFDEIEGLYASMEEQGRARTRRIRAMPTARSTSSAMPTCATSDRSTQSRSSLTARCSKPMIAPPIKQSFDDESSATLRHCGSEGSRRAGQRSHRADRPDEDTGAGPPRQRAARARSGDARSPYLQVVYFHGIGPCRHARLRARPAAVPTTRSRVRRSSKSAHRRRSFSPATGCRSIGSAT